MEQQLKEITLSTEAPTLEEFNLLKMYLQEQQTEIIRLKEHNKGLQDHVRTLNDDLNDLKNQGFRSCDRCENWYLNDEDCIWCKDCMENESRICEFCGVFHECEEDANVCCREDETESESEEEESEEEESEEEEEN